MITLITGVPGSGKTLYCVHDIIRRVIGTKVVEHDDDGNEVEHERIVFSNINGLKLDHELIDGSDTGGLRNWHQWCKPGSMIIYDEVQKVWPLRPNGSKVPDDIQHLDTHRHYGVDFVLMTQTVNNVDRHIMGLVGRHLHVRRIGNMPFAIIYEWDHCSRALQYSKSIAKKFFRYSKAVFKLYKSARVHTKVERKTPTLIYAVVIGLGVAAWGIPTYISRMKERTMGGGAVVKQEAQHVSPKASDPKGPDAAHAEKAPAQAAVAAAVEPEKPKIAGCAATATQCVCMTEQGQKIEAEPGFCQSMTAKPKLVLAGGNVDWYPDPRPPVDNSATWTGTVVGTRKGWQF